jgi:tetraacyldisaccharide 4'-kinase
LYTVAAAARRKRDEQKRVDFEVPVIVVGNLTVGGTGKTPLVIWLVARLSERGYRPGIVCSGYRGEAQDWPQRVTVDSEPEQVGDEAVLLAQRARCPVVAGPDRVANVQELLTAGTVDVVVSDDGLQHYRLGRSIEIAVIDGIRGLGNGLCLPAGPLREPAARLREVDAIVVNGGKWGHAGVFRAEVLATGVRQTATGTMKALEEFEDCSKVTASSSRHTRCRITRRSAPRTCVSKMGARFSSRKRTRSSARRLPRATSGA